MRRNQISFEDGGRATASSKCTGSGSDQFKPIRFGSDLIRKRGAGWRRVGKGGVAGGGLMPREVATGWRHKACYTFLIGLGLNKSWVWA